MPMVMMSHPLLGQANTPVYAPSSVGSTITIAQSYMIDSICISTPCLLHIPVGRAGKTKEVSKGLAIPVGSLFEGKPIPHHYACVTVLEINSNYGDHEIEIPAAEGIHCLGQSIGNTIRWHNQDILLSSVPSKHAIVDSTPPGPAPPAAASKEQWVSASPAVASKPVDWPEDHPTPDQASPQQQQVDLPEESQQQQEKVGYLYPYAICEVRHNFPSQWGDNHDKLAKAYQHYITSGGIHNPERPVEMVVHTNFPCYEQPSNFVHCGYYICERIKVLGRYITHPERVRGYRSYIGMPRRHGSRLHEQQLLNIGVDLCHFILHELAQEDEYVSLCEWENQEYRQC
uniref:DUF8039 domain-containing protein n=1 Tax=Setaria italica TaxID=4555 RepID=K4AJB6_SETIT